ncbi:hypothetical protein ACFYVL_29320 [Streptomyces sp. NPDC004111]|uniref:hypothetical protein n=1 Tax=Streptomyces sp. NPDC004111 TaxID=3364690 RepID=UPI0036B99FC2
MNTDRDKDRPTTPAPDGDPEETPVNSPEQSSSGSSERSRSPWPSVEASPYAPPTPPGPAQDPPTTALRTGPPGPPRNPGMGRPARNTGTGTGTGTGAGTGPGTGTRTGQGTGPGTDRSAAPPARARADSGAHPVPQFNQHRQYSDGDEPPAPDPAALDEDALDAARRRRATGFTTGVLHALGFTLLAVYEYFRATVSNLSPAQLAAGGSTELREIARTQADLMKQDWYQAVTELARILTFDQPRAFLWAAVLIAIVVRFNRSGPALLQIGLSVVAAGYCLLLAVVWFPFLYGLGGASFAALAASGALLWAATRR